MKTGWVLMCVGSIVLTGCASTSSPPVVDRVVDIERFMGDWYVIAGHFTFFERDAHNAVETYALNADGTIDTTFTFRRGGFDGPLKTFRPKGFVHDRSTNAEWRMQFVWPFKSAYLILYLDDEYEYTAVGVPNRKYLWIMSRTPSIPENRMQDILAHLASVDYDVTDLVYIPQQWPSHPPGDDGN